MRPQHRPLSRTAIATLIALGIAVVPALARAHPFGDEYYAHRLVLRMHDTSLDIEYSTEIPAQEIMLQFARRFAGVADVGPQHDLEFASARYGELGDNLVVILGDEVLDLDWQPLSDVPNGVGNGRFFVYHIRATVPHTITDESLEVLVTNDNAMNEAAYYSGWIFADPGIRVVRSSLEGMGAAASGKDVFQQEGAWSRDPVYRDISAALVKGEGTPTEGEVEAADEGGPDTPSLPWWILGILIAPIVAGVGVKILARRLFHSG
jgi:hypothetical protein